MHYAVINDLMCNIDNSRLSWLGYRIYGFMLLVVPEPFLHSLLVCISCEQFQQIYISCSFTIQHTDLIIFIHSSMHTRHGVNYI